MTRGDEDWGPVFDLVRAETSLSSAGRNSSLPTPASFSWSVPLSSDSVGVDTSSEDLRNFCIEGCPRDRGRRD